MIESLLKAIPDSDENCNLKRAEIRRWYQVYGNIIICPRDMENILSVLPELLNDYCFWDDNVRLDNAHLGEELLKRLNVSQQGERSFVFNLYKFACLICSENYIKNIFCKLDEDKDWEVEKYVPDVLSRYGPLMKFWSHYVNVVGEKSPNPVILKSFRCLLLEHNEDFEVNNIDDIWKCGFECAKQEGSREALEFFWDKLRSQYEEKEREEILFDVGIRARDLCSHKEANSFNLIEFSLKHLGTAKYEDFLKQDYEYNKSFLSILTLMSGYSYNEVKALIGALDFQDFSYDSAYEEYYSNLLCGTLEEMHKTPSCLTEYSFNFFSWLWNLEKFEKYKKQSLDDLSEVFRSLVQSTEVSVLVNPLELILSSASKKQIADECLVYSGRSMCSALYVTNERKLLQHSILNMLKDGDKFIGYIDNLILKTLSECRELKGLNICDIFDLYAQGKKKEFIESISGKVIDPQTFFFWLEDIVCTTFGKMIDGEVKFDNSISSQIGDVSSSALSIDLCKWR